MDKFAFCRPNRLSLLVVDVKKCVLSHTVSESQSETAKRRFRVAETTFFTWQPAMLMPASCYVYVYQLHHYSAVDSWQDRWCLDISAASRPPSWCVRTRNMVAKWSISVRTVMPGHMLCFRQRSFLFSFFLPFSSIITSIFSEAFLPRCRYR